jgi:hypothetical protein
MKTWKFFVGSCVLAAGILLKIGVPLVPLVVGIGVAALWNWRTHRQA